MKKFFTILAVAFMMMAVPAQAQLKFGLTGGVNLTQMSYSEDVIEDNASNKTGFFVGPTVTFTLPVVGLGFDASALYDQRSAESKSATETTTIKTKSIQVPINVRYGIGLGSMASVFAFAGPQFGFNIGDKSTAIGDAAEWTMKSSNMSVNLGVGAMLLGHLQAKINYNIAMGKTGEFELAGAAKTAAETAGSAVGLGDAKANSWQVSLTYLF